MTRTQRQLVVQPQPAPRDRREEVKAACDRLFRFYPQSQDFSSDSFERTRRLLAKLGNPHQKLPPTIHVAGTNGKGSTIAYLRAILEAGGHDVHVYTSPHLVKFNERIRLAGQLIDDDTLLDLIAEVEEVNSGGPITFFEITTVMAFLAFSRVPAKVLLLETGLGGRLDTTNIIEKPLLTVITQIAKDHQHILGDNIRSIAFEKAGIMKPGAACVSGRQDNPSITHVLRSKAIDTNCLLYNYGRWIVRDTGVGFQYEGGRFKLNLPYPRLQGKHQIDNAGLAIACLEQLPLLRIDKDAIKTGLKTVHWPARLHMLTQGPLIQKTKPGWDIWLDGGHNDGAGAALAAQAREWVKDKPLYIVTGMMSGKTPDAFLSPLRPYIAQGIAVPIPEENTSMTPEHLVPFLGNNPRVAQTASQAVQDLVRLNPIPGRILITGSLYLAGHVLENNY